MLFITIIFIILICLCFFIKKEFSRPKFLLLHRKKKQLFLHIFSLQPPTPSPPPPTRPVSKRTFKGQDPYGIVSILEATSPSIALFKGHCYKFQKSPTAFVTQKWSLTALLMTFCIFFKKLNIKKSHTRTNQKMETLL